MITPGFIGSVSVTSSGGGGGGSNVSISSFDTKVNTGAATVHSLVGVPAGTKLVLTTTCEFNGVNCTVSSSPSITWTKKADSNGVSGSAEIYEAVFTAGGSITVTSNWGAPYQASVCYILANNEAVSGGASNTASAQVVPSVAITSTRINSILFVATSDFNASNGGTNGASIVYRSTPTQRYYQRDAAHATLVHYTYAAATIQSYTVGWTAPDASGDAGMGTAVYEIRGN